MAASPSRGHNAGASRWGWVIPVVVGAVLIVASAVTAQGSSQDLGEMEWPPEEHQRFGDLADLVASVFANDTDPVRLGLTPIEQYRLESVNDTATRIIFQTQDGQEQSVLQRHENHKRSEGPHTFQVPPSDLVPTVQTQLDQDRNETSPLALTGPPGAFDLSGDSVQEKLENFTDALGFPRETISTNITTVAISSLYDRQSACLEEGSAESCNGPVRFRLDCPSCQLAGFNGPDQSGLDHRFGGGGFAVFDDQGRLLMVKVSYVFDLNESAVLAPEEARSQAAEPFQNRGYELEFENENLTAEDVKVVARLAPDRVEVTDVYYDWSFPNLPENASYPNASIEVRQDAVTGEIVQQDWFPGDAVEPVDPGEDSDPVDSNESSDPMDPDGDSDASRETVPGIRGIGMLVAAVVAVLARRRSSP